MKKLILALSLCFTSLNAVSINDFLSKAIKFEQEQYDRLQYDRLYALCLLMEELSVEDRTIIYVFLDELEDEHVTSVNDSEVCDECAAGEICTESK